MAHSVAAPISKEEACVCMRHVGLHTYRSLSRSVPLGPFPSFYQFEQFLELQREKAAVWGSLPHGEEALQWS